MFEWNKEKGSMTKVVMYCAIHLFLSVAIVLLSLVQNLKVTKRLQREEE